jgi:hypothetical protein
VAHSFKHRWPFRVICNDADRLGHKTQMCRS